MSDEHKYPPEDVPRQRMPAGQVLIVVVAALVLAAFLNADRLDYTARTQPFGWKRNALMQVTGGLKAVSHATFLDRPRRRTPEPWSPRRRSARAPRPRPPCHRCFALRACKRRSASWWPVTPSWAGSDRPS